MAIEKQGGQGEFFDELEIMPAETREKYLDQRLSQTIDNAYRHAPAVKTMLDRVGIGPPRPRVSAM